MANDKDKKEIVIHGFKGFNKDMTCRGFQYEVGKEYETDQCEPCESGFHACENPLDVLRYYPPSKSVFCKTEQCGEVKRHSEDSKVASTKIKIIANVGLKGILEAGFELIFSKIKWGKKDTPQTHGDSSAAQTHGNYSAAQTHGDSSAAQTHGDSSAAQTHGYFSAAQTHGYSSAAQTHGNSSAAQTHGYSSAAQTHGNSSAAQTHGDSSAAQTHGYSSAAQTHGNYSAAQTHGNYSAASVFGEESIAVSTGYNGKAMGKLGSWFVLADWENGKINYVKSAKVDGKKIKADTWYRLENGKFKVAE